MRLSGCRWRGQQALPLHLRVEPSTVVNTVLGLLEKLEEEDQEERDPDSAAARAGENPLHPARAPKALEDLHQENRITHPKARTVRKKLLKICF